MIIIKGVTRIVFLTKTKAYKIPNVSKLKWFLKGWLANMQEVDTWKIFNNELVENKTIKLKLCPIVNSYLKCFVVIMPLCKLATESDMPFENELKDICGDFKSDNYGWYENRLVCLDYGQ